MEGYTRNRYTIECSSLKALSISAICSRKIGVNIVAAQYSNNDNTRLILTVKTDRKHLYEMLTLLQIQYLMKDINWSIKEDKVIIDD